MWGTSLIWPLSLVAGIALGLVLSRRRAPREAALGGPLIAVFAASEVVWVLEAYLAIGGFGHYGLWLLAYGLLFAALATGVYLASYLVTRAICDRTRPDKHEQSEIP